MGKYGSPALDYHWNWYQIQLESGEEIMLVSVYVGDTELFVSGTYVGADCSVQELSADDFDIAEVDYWTSPHSGITYSSGWVINLPNQGLNLTLNPVVIDQELYRHSENLMIDFVAPNYWEGAVDVAGVGPQGPIVGLGYVELT